MKINEGFYKENYQSDLYDHIYNNISTEKNSELALHGVTQSGKTNAMLWLTCHLFDGLVSKRGIDPYILYISNESSNDLREQTVERFLPVFRKNRPEAPNLLTNLTDDKFNYNYLDRQTDFEHRSYFDNSEKRRCLVNKIKNQDATVIFFDEAHIAMKNDGSIHNFLDMLDIDPSKDASEWGDHNIHLVLVSATGYVQMAQPQKIKHYFVKPGKTHVSQNDIYECGKVHNISNDIRKNKDFLKRLYEDAKKENKHILIRYQGDKDTSWIKNNVFPNETIKEFSSYSKDIRTINSYALSTENEPSCVLLIRGGLRVGITLENHLKKKVKYAVDTNSTYASTVAQSLLGRFTGYPASGYSKEEWIDELPDVYCNLDVLEGPTGHLQYERKVMDENWSVLPNIPSDSNVVGSNQDTSSYIMKEFDDIDDLVSYANSIGHNITKHEKWKNIDTENEFISESYRGNRGVLTKEFVTGTKPSGGTAKYQTYACYEDTSDPSSVKFIHYERVEHSIAIPSDSNVIGSSQRKSYVIEFETFDELDDLLNYTADIGHNITKHKSNNWREKSNKNILIKDSLRNRQSKVLSTSYVENNKHFGINENTTDRSFATYTDTTDPETLTFVHIHNTGRTFDRTESATIRSKSMYNEKSKATKNKRSRTSN